MTMNKFNCVEMKQRGAQKVLAKTTQMTTKEKLEFWQRKTRNLMTRKTNLTNRKTMFTTYENRNNPHIAIHRSTCNQLRKRGGKGLGKYEEHKTYEKATNYAQTTDLPIKDCSFCKPQSSKVELIKPDVY